MAHNIEIRNGVTSYAENGRKERAWHGLGQVFDTPMTVRQALEASHADYTVEKQEVFAMTPAIKEAMAAGTVDADLILDALIGGRKATMRMDDCRPLGIVSDQYGVVQNETAFQFIDTLCSGEMGNEHVPVIETAGVLGSGERVFITAKFPESIILNAKQDDRVDMYVVFTTSHDGTGAVNCLVTPTRVVCNNTLNFAMRHNVGKLSMRHTSGISNRLDLAKKENAEFAFRALKMYETYKEHLEASFTRLQNIKLAERDLNNIMAEVLLSEANAKVYRETQDIYHKDISSVGRNIFLNVRETMEKGIGQDLGERGTAMWAINGLTTYYQNAANFRSDEVKFDSIQQGHAARQVQRAYELMTA